jgi:hypothetical protein
MLGETEPVKQVARPGLPEVREGLEAIGGA